MKKILLITVASSFIIACNSENGGNANAITPEDNKPAYLSVEEIEQRLNLPEEITMDEANISVLGPLTEDNIRKDLKRKIGFAAPEDTPEAEKTRKVYNRLAQIWTEMIQNQDNTEKLIELDYEREVLWECVITDYINVPNDLKTFLFYLPNGSDDKAIVYDKINEQLTVDYGEITPETYMKACDEL